MPRLNLNKLLPTRDGESGGTKESGRINMHSLLTGEESPEQKSKGINLGGLFNSAERRAQKAAEQQRLVDLRRADEERKIQESQAAREIIRNAGGGPRNLPDDPVYRAGYQPALRRLASKNEVQAARLAQERVEAIRKHNDDALFAKGQIAGNLESVHQSRRNLNEHPITNTQVNWGSRIEVRANSPLATRAAKRTAKITLGIAAGAVTHSVRSALAVIAGHPENSFDAIRVDGAGLHLTAPLQPITSRDIAPQDLGGYDMAPDPPSWLDKPIGLLSQIPWVDRRNLEAAVPFGRLVIRDRGNGNIIAAPVSWRPGRLKQQILSGLGRIRPVEGNIPALIPEPAMGDLLGEASVDFLDDSDQDTA